MEAQHFSFGCRVRPLSAVLGLLALAFAASAAPDAPLTTPWGEKVTDANAWREYPRPQLVRDGWTNLNGAWDYAVTSVTNTPGLVGEKGQPLVFRAYDAKYNMLLSLAGSPTRYLVKDSAFPKDAAGKARRPERFVVTPIGCFDNRGQSLTVSA